MADWRKRATLVSGDVVYYEYVTFKTAKMSELVYIWDIDKTYLDTHFESLKGLVRVALEKAFQKRNVPGTGSLVRALTSSRGVEDTTKPFPIFFISASPPQLENKIRAKLELDGIKAYGAFFKDNLRNLRPRLWWKLNKQVGYKIQALLELRTRLKEDVRQILWGDDSESDATVYALYSDMCARRIKPNEIRYILSNLHVTGAQTEHILELIALVPESDPVEKVYINLAVDTDPEYYGKFGRRTVATYNTFQAALDLYQDKRITAQQVLRVAQDMLMNYGFTPEELAWAIDDLILRGMLKAESVEPLIPILMKPSLLPARYKVARPDLRLLGSSGNAIEENWIPDSIDYLNDFR